jgi:hypothetical protein
LTAPRDLPAAPDDAFIVRRYRSAGGPPLPLAIPPARPPVLCHGDWTDGNLLAVGSEITAILAWGGSPTRALWNTSTSSRTNCSLSGNKQGRPEVEPMSLKL